MQRLIVAAPDDPDRPACDLWVQLRGLQCRRYRFDAVTMLRRRLLPACQLGTCERLGALER